MRDIKINRKDMPLTTRKQSSSLFSLCWRCQELGENTEFGPLRTNDQWPRGVRTDDQLAKQDTQMPPRRHVQAAS